MKGCTSSRVRALPWVATDGVRKEHAVAWVCKIFALHAYAVLFGWVLIEQGGLPVPRVPLMLAAGGMSAAHKLHIA